MVEVVEVVEVWVVGDVFDGDYGSCVRWVCVVVVMNLMR